MASKISYDWLNPTITATSSATNYPIANITDRTENPYNKVWRSTAVTQQDIELDFAASHTLEAVVLLNCNFTSFKILEGASLGAIAEISGSPFTPAKNVEGYYNFIHVASLTQRYVVIRITAQTPINSETYFELGLIQVVDSLTDLTASPNQGMTETVSRPYHVVGNNRSPSIQKMASGAFRLQREMEFVIAEGSGSIFEDLALQGEDNPFIFYENLGSPEDVFFCRLEGAIKVSRRSTTRQVNPVFRSFV